MLPELTAEQVAADARGRPRAALHPAAAAVLGGDAREDAGGARDRPAVDVRLDHRHDPAPRVRHARGQALPARGHGRGRHRQADRALPRRRRRRTSRPTWRRSSTTSPRASSARSRCSHEFNGPFERALEKAEESFERFQEDLDELCPLCPTEGREPGKLQVKLGRYGKFIGCPNYPECRYIRNMDGSERPEPELLDETCPDCGRQLQQRVGRFGPFIGCSGYPDCRYIKKDPPRTRSASPVPSATRARSSRSGRGSACSTAATGTRTATSR